MLTDDIRKVIRDRSVIDVDSSGDEFILLTRLAKVVGHSHNRIIKIMTDLEFDPIFIGHKLMGWRLKPEVFFIQVGDTPPVAAFSKYLRGAKVEATNMLRYGCGNVVIADISGTKICRRLYKPDSDGRSGFGWSAWSMAEVTNG